MNAAISDWSRVCRYIQRFNLLELVIQSENTNDDEYVSFQSHVPQEYIDFVNHFGYPTLFLDEDIYIQFYSHQDIIQHPSCTSSFVPFATCDLEENSILGFQKENANFQVVSYEDSIVLGREGDFNLWMKKQVNYFLMQMSHFDFSDRSRFYQNRMQRGK